MQLAFVVLRACMTIHVVWCILLLYCCTNVLLFPVELNVENVSATVVFMASWSI